MSAKTDVHFSSEEFLTQLQQRQTNAISRLVQSYTEPLFKACLGLGFDSQAAEELVQRVWSTFFDVASNFEGRSHIRTFLFGILYNKASEMRREEKKIAKNDPIEDTMESRFSGDGNWTQPPIDPEQFLHQSQMTEIIKKCIDFLPLNQRMAFCLKEIDDKGSSDICKILEVSNTNLGVLLFRARNRLRECIEKKAKQGN